MVRLAPPAGEGLDKLKKDGTRQSTVLFIAQTRCRMASRSCWGAVMGWSP